jgi:hypothetical protein
MPSGETHLKIWKVGLIASIPASVYLAITKQPVTGLAFCIGYFYHLICDPDLDEMGITGAESRMIKIPILGWLMYALSSVYGVIFRKHHRSFATHFPGISTAIRLLVFFFWIPILYYFGIIKWQEWQGFFVLWFWIGLSFADALHWGADKVVSDTKDVIQKLNPKKERKSNLS